MIMGWIDLFKRRLMYRHEFVSADARRLSNDPRTYEMLDARVAPQPNLKSPEAAVVGSLLVSSTPLPSYKDSKTDHFGHAGKKYRSPEQSFSTPRPPSVSQAREWDSRTTHARGLAYPGAELSKDFRL